MPEDPHSPSERETGRNQPRPQPEDTPTGRRLLSVGDAADHLGITTDAVRGRIKRGTLGSERRGGNVFVWMEEADQTTTGRDTSRPDDDQPGGQSSSPDTELVEVLREQVEYMRDQLQQERDANRENRRIIAGLTQRIPELPASASETTPDEPQEAEPGGSAPGRGDVPESPERPGEGVTARPQAARFSSRPSLWRRIFGGAGGE